MSRDLQPLFTVYLAIDADGRPAVADSPLGAAAGKVFGVAAFRRMAELLQAVESGWAAAIIPEAEGA